MKSPTSENVFDDIHTFLLYEISSQVWYVVTQWKFRVVSTYDTRKDVCYIEEFTLNPYTIHYDVSIDKRTYVMVEQVVNACYLINMRKGYKWYKDTLW